MRKFTEEQTRRIEQNAAAQRWPSTFLLLVTGFQAVVIFKHHGLTGFTWLAFGLVMLSALLAVRGWAIALRRRAVK